MSAIQELVGEIRIDSSGVVSGTTQAQKELGNLEGKAKSVGSSMKSAGETMSKGVTAPLVAMGATAVHQAATFESAMQQSIAIMGDVSEAERRDLEQTAREVAKSTTMSHEQSASSYYYLASAGLDATESIAAMPQVAAYAESAQLDMATATDYATDIMTAFGYKASELSTVTDVLTQAVSNHNTTAEGMGNAMAYVAPVANSLGVSIEETAAAIGMFSDVGIKGSKAGTSLRAVLSSLAAPSSKQAELMNELGLNVMDAQGNMIPMVDIVKQLEDAGADTADVMGLFGREAGPAMAALLQEGSGALAENTKALEESEGATQKVAETQRDTLMGSLQILKSNVSDLAITFGNELTPAIRAAADMASVISTNFATIPSPMRKVIIAAAAIVAAIGPLLFIFGTILTMVPSFLAGWATLSGAFAAVSAVLSGGLIPALGAAATTIGSVLAPAIGILLGPIGIAIGAVALLAAAWATNFGGIRGQTMRVVGVLREELAPAIEWLRGVATKVMSYFGGEGASSFAKFSEAAKPVISLIADGLIVAIRGLGFVGRMVFTGLATVFSVFHTVATTAIRGVQAVLAPVFNWMSKFWAAHGAIIRQEAILTWNVISARFAAGAARVRAIVSQLVAFVRPIYVALMSALRTITNTVLAGMRAFWSVWGSDIMSVVRLLKNTVVTIVQQLMQGISTLIRVGLAVLRGDWLSAWNLMVTYVNRTTVQIQVLVNRWSSALTRIVKKLVGRIIGFFQNLYQRLVGGSIIPNMVNAIIRAFTNLRNRAVALVTNLRNQVVSRVTNLKNRAVSQAQNLRSRFVSVVANLKARVQQQIASMLNNVIGTIRGKISDIKSAGKSLVTSFVNGIKSQKSRPGRVVAGMMQRVRDKFTRSDAKEGPLSDISKTGPALVETFAAGIEANAGRAASAAETVAMAAKRPLESLTPKGELFSLMDRVNEVMMNVKVEGRDSVGHHAVNRLQEFAAMFGRDFGRNADKLIDFAEKVADWRMGGGAPDINPGYTPVDPANYERKTPAVGGDIAGTINDILGRGSYTPEELKTLDRIAQSMGEDFRLNESDFRDPAYYVGNELGKMGKLIDWANRQTEQHYGGRYDDLLKKNAEKAGGVGGDIESTINDILGRGSYTPEELKTLDRIAQSMGEDFRLNNADFRDPAYYVGNELGKMGKLIDWANRQTEQHYGGRYDDLLKKNAEKMGGMVESTVSSLKDAVANLSHSQRMDLSKLLADTGFVDKYYQASAMLRKFGEGGTVQGLKEALSGERIRSELDRMAQAGPRDEGKMVRAEDGSWVPASYYNRDEEARNAGKIQAEDGTWVDPSFYNRTSEPMSAEGGESPDEVGRLVAHAVQETLAGSELKLDTNGDELVEKATLKVKQERQRNVRKSPRTTR